MSEHLQWDFPTPFIMNKTVEQRHIDVMGHTNNVVYLRWCEEVAWAHSNMLGLDWPTYQRLNRALVARKHEIEYLAATFEGDELIRGTWIVENDGKLSLHRAYQFIRASDGKTVLRGRTHWVCVDIQSGAAKRMPIEFAKGYPPVV